MHPKWGILLKMKQSSMRVAARGNRDEGSCSFTDHLTQLSASDPRMAIFLAMPTAARTNALIAILESAAGENFRQEASRWIVQALSVERLVPPQYAEWRPVVREAMLYFGSHLSTSRLAPKLVEQMELPVDTTPENRLLRLIAKVPALQKLGQVIARNRHLHPSVRRALTQLENGICDASAEEIRTIIDPSLRTTRLRSKTKYSWKQASAQWCDSPGTTRNGGSENTAFSK
jgi:hypothetical protein